MRKKRGCRNTIVILIAIWIGIVMFYPRFFEWYGQVDSRRVCSNIPENTQTFVQDPLPEISVDMPIAPITIQNVPQLAPITDIEPLENFPIRQFGGPILPHPSGNYRIFVDSYPSKATTLTVCDADGKSLKTLLRDETTSVKFSPDYTLFTVSEERFGNIELYDAETLERVAKINVREGQYTLVGSLAFHPTEPILAFTRNVRERDIFELYLWNIETDQLIDAIDFGEILDNSLTFNAEGTLLYFKDAEGGHVWGIPTDD